MQRLLKEEDVQDKPPRSGRSLPWTNQQSVKAVLADAPATGAYTLSPVLSPGLQERTVTVREPSVVIAAYFWNRGRGWRHRRMDLAEISSSD
jgi:hypothetical protein